MSNMIKIEDAKGVWVFCEQREGKLMPTVLELLSEANWPMSLTASCAASCWVIPWPH